VHPRSLVLRAALSLLGATWAVVVLAICGPASSAVQPSVIGGWAGSPLSGAAVALTNDGVSCTGVLWRPRIVITAAHCVVDGYSVRSPKDWRLHWPGLDTSLGEAPARVTSIIVDRYWRASSDDVAFLVLDKTLGIPVISRIAEPAEVAALANQGAQATYVGYGLTSARSDPNAQKSPIPLAVEETMLNTAWSGAFQASPGILRTQSNGIIGTCAGDSGGPWMVNTGTEVLLLGVMSAGAGMPCDDPQYPGRTYEVIALVAPQQAFMNQALKAAGDSLSGRWCLTDPTGAQTCGTGRTWAWTGCSPARINNVAITRNGKPTPAAKITGLQTGTCPPESPWRITAGEPIRKANETITIKPAAGTTITLKVTLN
jgi:hypothetical protein